MTHAPEPKAGSFRTSDGQHADLFDASHYPVQAVCRVCSEPIRADSFLRPFVHTDTDAAPTAVVRHLARDAPD